MSISKMFSKSYDTLRSYPGLIVFALVLIILLNIIQLPLFLNIDTFYPSFEDMSVEYLFEQFGYFAFPESPPGGTPLNEGAFLEPQPGEEGDITENQTETMATAVIILGTTIFIFILSIFLAPAYLGIVRDAISEGKSPQASAFFAYGKKLFLKFLGFFLLLAVAIFLLSILFGLIAVILGGIFPAQVEFIGQLYHLFGFLLAFFLIFVEFELVEGSSMDKLTDAIGRSIRKVSKNKLKILTYVASFVAIGVLTILVGMVFNMLPMAISMFVIPLLYGLVTTFLLVSLYHAFYSLSNKEGEEVY
ncbi:hypothetical protein [Natranaerobius thermophilus]|uniref:Uncharacterized protein n=1 Tax=Natranaerobius thermophilus (strain ATCC BAA-1301 / DSM 18059 / JW/NM-WN-LF) TaxID=457570 RepID=B2A1B8_NATTJ|nr:hypothetical protein [Natranaerobius thermophilus]ACB86056.1 hypothetical protein Nther_2493 [Natranaerobius thermophilus JW/NM-WN-LF]